MDSKSPLRLVESEVRTLASLHHPNIIRWHACFQELNTVCVVTEYAAGGTLRELIARRAAEGAPLPAAAVRLWARQLASALREVHTHGIIHRDIKPENIFLSAGADLAGSIVKLGDFGFSIACADGAYATSSVGTPFYMAPERFMSGHYNAAVDLWGAGCVLYEMLCMRRPFRASHLAELFELVREVKYDEATLAAAPYPHPLTRLASRECLLHPDPSQRMTSEALVDALDALDRDGSGADAAGGSGDARAAAPSADADAGAGGAASAQGLARRKTAAT